MEVCMSKCQKDKSIKVPKNSPAQAISTKKQNKVKQQKYKTEKYKNQKTQNMQIDAKNVKRCKYVKKTQKVQK